MEVRPRVLAERIAEVLGSEDPGLAWLREGVRRHGFLPLHLGWTEVLGVLPDGKLVRWPHEDAPDSLEELVEPFWRRVALVQGARTYPNLGLKFPERPDGAADCLVCGGRGQFPARPEVICACGGTGWVLPEEDRSAQPR